MIRSDKRLPFGGADSASCDVASATVRCSDQVATAISDDSAYGCSGTVKKIKDMPLETKCRISTDYKTGRIYVHAYYKGGCIESYNLMPDIADVNVIKDQDGNDRAVVVKFCDHTETKATLNRDDVYSLEQGISVCVTKRLLFEKIGANKSSAMYNKVIKRALQVMKNNEKMREQEIQECQRKEKKYAKLAEKKRMRKERIAATRREAEIELRKEAYKRAIMELEKERAEA